MTSSPCLVCREPRVEPLLDLGPQPVCNRFPRDEKELEFTHPLVFGACRACGTAQLVGPAPAAELRPRCDWIVYNEPEPHLDGLAARLRALPGVGPDTVVGAVSSKDDSLLRRLEALGIEKTWRLDPREDLGVTQAGVGVETIQDALTVEKARAAAARRGAADLVIARHIFEHAHDPAGFFAALAAMGRPGARILLEAPDCARAFGTGDVSTLWEEHTLYLTGESFKGVLSALGASVEHYEEHPYAMENSMVAVARAGAAPRPSASASAFFEQARAFAAAVAERGQGLRAWADAVKASGGRIAVFGAGHLGALWVNALGLRERIAFFVDDNPNKKGLRMPGSRLPIKGSEALLSEGVTWALMAFSPDAEEKVMTKNAAFAAKGGRFASIFPGSPRSLR